MILKIFFFAFLVTLACEEVASTNAFKCPPQKGNLTQGVLTVSACKGPPCRLRRKSDVVVQIKLKPDRDIKSVQTNVHAVIVGIPFPFIGVDGTNACNFMYNEDGKTKATCPLKKDQNYVYRNSFKVLEAYPKIKVLVHWALTDTSTNTPIECFRLPARITN